MRNDTALIIFIKNPELGKVKTRLAKTVGDEKALAIYKALLGHTRKIAEKLPVNRYLFYSQYIHPSDNWSPKKFKKALQAEGDLGNRITTAFQKVFQENEKVVIIGSDCASLTPEIVQEAFDKLDTHSFVVGPAVDGGYYLLGMNQFFPEVFRDIEWSTSAVFPTTIKRIKALKTNYHLLPALSDIDYEEDWEQYGWEIPEILEEKKIKL